MYVWYGLLCSKNRRCEPRRKENEDKNTAHFYCARALRVCVRVLIFIIITAGLFKNIMRRRRYRVCLLACTHIHCIALAVRIRRGTKLHAATRFSFFRYKTRLVDGNAVLAALLARPHGSACVVANMQRHLLARRELIFELLRTYNKIANDDSESSLDFLDYNLYANHNVFTEFDRNDSLVCFNGIWCMNI